MSTTRLCIGDAKVGVAKLPAASIDLVLTDPPYGMNYRSNWRENKFDSIAGDSDTNAFADIVADLHRVLRDDRHIYVFCSWHKIDEFKRLVERYFTLKNVLVWNKNNHGSGDLTGSFAPKHEFILFAHKGRRALNRRIPDVLPFDRVHGSRMIHPTEKPAALLETLVELSTAPGETVLDPFAGSGSTLRAARKIGRGGLGFEMSTEYALAAATRLFADL